MEPTSTPTPHSAIAPNISTLPILYSDLGAAGRERVFEFFAATIRNRNTRLAYLHAALAFGRWCDAHSVAFATLRPLHVAAYIEHLGARLAKPSVKQHLAAIRQLLDYLVAGNLLPFNPAAPVRGPKYVVKRGKTPVLTRDEARHLFDSIAPTDVAGLRDRALLAVLLFGFARIGAALAMNVCDYATEGRRALLRLHEKGGKEHAVPAHHLIEEYVDAYLVAADIVSDRNGPLFRTVDAHRRLSDRRLQRREALAMIKRRARQAGLSDSLSCHSFRATGITLFRSNGGTLETAAALAAHESPRTTKLYDRSTADFSLTEIERVQL